jgi:hypothetical protein
MPTKRRRDKVGNYLHEIEPETARTEDEPEHLNPNPDELQSIEHGTPHNKGDIGSMPEPIRYFGYFFFTSAALMLIIGLVLQFFK